MHIIQRRMLVQRFQELKVRGGQLFSVCYERKGVKQYHFYEGGPRWIPTIPSQIASPGEILEVLVHPVSDSEFIRSISKINYDKTFGTESASISLSGFRMNDNSIEMCAEQLDAVGQRTTFKIEGTILGPARAHFGEGFIGFKLEDRVGQTRQIRLCHDGHSEPRLALFTGHYFSKIFGMSFDETRLKIMYREPRNSRTTSVYLKDPSALFRVVEMNNSYPWFDTSTIPHSGRLYDVKLDERVKVSQLRSTYRYGRLGAEIAYVIAKERLGLRRVILVEPSRGGKDLFTRDGSTVIQARLLVRQTPVSLRKIGTEIRRELEALTSKLKQDFTYNSRADKGYAILSILGPRERVMSIVLPVGRRV